MQSTNHVMAVLISTIAGMAQAATLGQVIDSFPQPQCANVLPMVLTMGDTPTSPSFVWGQQWTGTGAPAFRTLNAGSNTAYTPGLDATSNQPVEIRPQLQNGGDVINGGIGLNGYIDGQFVNNITMLAPTQRHYLSARLWEMNPAAPWSVKTYMQFNGTLGFETVSDAEPPLRDRKVKELQYFPQFNGYPGAYQETVFSGFLAKGTYFLTTDFYTIGHWFSTVKGKSYCGKGFRNRIYSGHAVNPVNIR
ncbi:hypothetical protein FNU76_18670 [Chitinimonas arctica]|uniref:PEP-CTERM sorting domain-containing protein n=1 Tax=Chitinimonas arctica TaxID=2594795 RepID=A0A516SJI6_9NEIS|nr:hypothetical protein [Chitinimonas arctica]QDQ28208.1 hypothetical protein FNU76_18670 [Chitinimonas arctica]